MRHSLTSLVTIAFAIGSILGAARASAQGDALEALLSESIESTSGKAAGTADAAPALSISVTAEDLRRYGIRTLAEAYNYLVMGLHAEDPLADPEIGSRGVLFPADGGKHVLLLIDGHTINDQQSGAASHGHGLGIPIEMIDHVEVVLGPGSVLYGANAMFGVINVITKRAKDFASVHLIAEASLSPPLNQDHDPVGPGSMSPYLDHLGHTYRLAAGAGHEFSLGGERAELTAGIEYYTLGGPTMTWRLEEAPLVDFGPRGTFGTFGGRTSASYYEQTPSVYARLMAGDFDVSVQAVSSRVSAPYVRLNDRPLDSTEFDDPDAHRERRRLSLELEWRHNLSDVTSVFARVYTDLSNESFRLHQRAFFGCFEPFIPRSYRRCELSSWGYARSLGSEWQATFDWTKNRKLVTMLGVDGRVRAVGYENEKSEPAADKVERYSDVARNERTGAAYAQQIYSPASWLTLNAGARWDFDSEFGNRISPRGAVIVEPWSGGTVKAIYSEALRAPTMDERTYRDPQLALPSNNLQAESVRSLEAIFSERFGSDSLVFGLFRSWWSNMIVRHALYRTYPDQTEDSLILGEAQRTGALTSNIEYAFQYRNIGSIDNWGLNGGWEGSASMGRLTYALNVTSAYTRSRTPEGSRLLPVTPAWFGNARISYDLQRHLPVVALATHFGGKRLADVGEDAGFAPLPFAPPSLDFRSTVSGPFPNLERLSYRLMVDYSFAPTAPYTAGRVLNARMGAAPSLIPENRFTLMLGLQLSL